jgi:uncharacterized SAM-binding protein YcdF (DUF218 family)
MTAPSQTNGSERKSLRPTRVTVHSVLLSIVILGGLSGVVWAGRHAALREAATLWIVSDSPAPADAAAIFGGGLDFRPFAAARYYRGGLVPKILVSNTSANPAERLGVQSSNVRANMEVLEKLGLPGSAIQPFGSNLRDTYEEALALHDWVVRNGAHTILVPTDIFAARRFRWILHHVFGRDAVVLVTAVDPPDYSVLFVQMR